MEKFIKHTGIAAPLDRANVDTDAIIPKQFLRKIDRIGFGKHLFHELRFLDYEGTTENPEFVLNQPVYRQASILLARDNFGCGSSREHAPWALSDFGFRVIVAPSFADIFANNCVKNGMLLITLPTADVDKLFKQVAVKPGALMTADLEAQVLIDAEGNKHPFTIDAFNKKCLLNGLDQIGWTLQYEEDIKKYETQLATSKPWLK